MICAHGQTTIPVATNLSFGYYGPDKKLIKLDPLTRIPIGDVPFDRYFILRIYYPDSNFPMELKLQEDGGESIKLSYFIIPNAGSKSYDASDANLTIFPNAIDVVVPPLMPNRSSGIYRIEPHKRDVLDEYLRVFKGIYDHHDADARKNYNAFRKQKNGLPAFQALLDYYSQQRLDTILASNNGDLAASRAAIETRLRTNMYARRFADKPNRFDENIYKGVQAEAGITTLQAKVETSAKFALVGDAGVVYAGFQDGFNTASPYVGANWSFRPMDSDLPFAYLRRSKRVKWYERFTINTGLTLSSMAKAEQRANLFGNNNLMLGGGYKFSHVINITGGGLFFLKIDPNPLVDKKKLGVVPYAGISINLKISSALGELAKVFTYAK